MIQETSGGQVVEGISESDVKLIINNRYRAAFVGLSIISILGVITFTKQAYRTNLNLLPIFGILDLLLISLIILNYHNRITIRPSYRTWNKIVYIYLAKLLIIGSIINSFSSLLKILNPMHGYKDPTALSRTNLGIGMAVSAGTGIAAARNLKPAKLIDRYFNQLSK